MEEERNNVLLNLKNLNAAFAAENTLLQPIKIIRWAVDIFGSSLVMSSSFGRESALLLYLVTKMVPDIPVIVINTGYLFPSTYRFMIELAAKFRLNLKVYSSPMSPKEMEKSYGKLWKMGSAGRDLFHEIRKLDPMRRALKELGVKAMISGVRSDQTTHRSSLQYVDLTYHGLYQIHPILAWNQGLISTYFEDHDLPLHPLWKRYGSIGDTVTTLPGKGRTGRLLGNKKECGLHTTKL